MPTLPASTRLQAAITGLLTCVAVLSATAPGRARELALDDAIHLGRYPRENSSLSILEVIRLRHWQDVAGDGLWRPLPKLLWCWEGAHSTELAWLVTGLLAGVVAALFLAAFAPPRRVSGVWVAAAVAGVVHPVACDVLVPFVGQSDLLALAGVFAALATFRRDETLAWPAGGLLLLSALLCKESALPALGAIPVALLLAGGARRARARRARRAIAMGALVLGVRLLLQVMLAGGLAPASGAAGGRLEPGELPFGPMDAVALTTLKLLVPSIPQTDYSFLKQPGFERDFHPWQGAVALAAWAVALGWTVRPEKARRANALLLRRRRQMAAALCWMALFLLPYAQLVPFGALWGGRLVHPIAFGASWMLAAWGSTESPRRRRLLFAVLVAYAATGLACLGVRSAEWRAPRLLWESEVRRVPEHAFALKNLAVEFQRAGDVGSAYKAIVRATELWPSFGEGWIARGQIARAAHHPGDARSALARAAELLPGHRTVVLEQARLDASEGRLREAASAVGGWLQANGPDDELSMLLGRLHADLQRRSPHAGSEGP